MQERWGVMGWIWGKFAIGMTYDQKLASFSFLHGREALILVAERYFAGMPRPVHYVATWTFKQHPLLEDQRIEDRRISIEECVM
jgi:hypothetical protein